MNENTIYYVVKPVGEPDICHSSKDCAGNYTKEITRDEVEPWMMKCGVCMS